MARFVTDFSSSKTEQEIDAIVLRFIKKEKFKLKKYKGGEAFKSGIGFLTAPKFMLIRRQGRDIHIEAWIKAMGEQDFNGVVAIVPKKALKSAVNKLIADLR